jgi:Family of unknown function (DUF6064)
MPEWWTYSLSDFLLFSPRAYYRLIERHNAAIWPLQFGTIGLGLAVVRLWPGHATWRRRMLAGFLAILWGWVAWAFVWRRYASINWAVEYLAWLFLIEALLLVWIGVIQARLMFARRRDAAGLVGLALFLGSLLGYPLLAPLLGRGWGAAEVVGAVPDPTAVATLGLVLMADGFPRWSLLTVPMLWCTISGATLLALGSPEAWGLFSSAVLAAGASVWSGVIRRGSAGPPVTDVGDLASS